MKFTFLDDFLDREDKSGNFPLGDEDIDNLLTVEEKEELHRKSKLHQQQHEQREHY